MKKNELNKEPNKRRKNETNEKKMKIKFFEKKNWKKKKMAKISKTGIFLKKGLGSTYTP